jgi:hypothetical protein
MRRRYRDNDLSAMAATIASAGAPKRNTIRADRKGTSRVVITQNAIIAFSVIHTPGFQRHTLVTKPLLSVQPPTNRMVDSCRRAKRRNSFIELLFRGGLSSLPSPRRFRTFIYRLAFKVSAFESGISIAAASSINQQRFQDRCYITFERV